MSTAYKKVTFTTNQQFLSSALPALAASPWPLVGLLLLGLLTRLVFALQPLGQLLIWLEDDAWCR
jgi:hypothetical protein